MSQTQIFDEIRQAIESIKYGSVEVIVQNGEVTQISTRIIKKTQTKSSPQASGAIIRKGSKSGININFKY